MADAWVYSDPHFYHDNITKFTNYDGSKMRPWDDAETMTEEMIEMYNDTVRDKDRVYILGDVAFSKPKFASAVSRLRGRKVIVLGNHDPVKSTALYNELGLDVRGYVVKHGYIMSHIPLHPSSLGRWAVNIHGHLHNNEVMDDGVPDRRYFCACVERTGFRPIALQEILNDRQDIIKKVLDKPRKA